MIEGVENENDERARVLGLLFFFCSVAKPKKRPTCRVSSVFQPVAPVPSPLQRLLYRQIVFIASHIRERNDGGRPLDAAEIPPKQAPRLRGHNIPVRLLLQIICHLLSV